MIAESAALGGEVPPAPLPCAVMPDVRRDGSYRKSKRQRNMPSEQEVRQEPDLQHCGLSWRRSESRQDFRLLRGADEARSGVVRNS